MAIASSRLDRLSLLTVPKLARRFTATYARNALCRPTRSLCTGLTGAFLADKPLFAAVGDEFLLFVGDAPRVAHNAGFDIAFLNAELLAAVYVELTHNTPSGAAA
jgi:hypothetical protein